MAAPGSCEPSRLASWPFGCDPSRRTISCRSPEALARGPRYRCPAFGCLVNRSRDWSRLPRSVHARIAITDLNGHTHHYEVGWPLKTASGGRFIVQNTGAFQRTVDEAVFLARLKANNLSPNEALRKIKLEDLPPCYSAVLATCSPSGVAQSKTWRWHQEEGGTGDLVDPGDDQCN